ncbi:MAG: hypothetical protein C4567_06085 [Deltaproteobacteria bacterium]|nr:MAG: hypothetical protein C4567_06085 [Deltaproteobacteria bacterium]
MSLMPQISSDSQDDKPSAVTFLGLQGRNSIVSLGCGSALNRIDNHIRLMAALNLTFYVGIDRVPEAAPSPSGFFSDPDEMEKLLARIYRGDPQRFWRALKLFPNTWVEELWGFHCAAVVCQRVEPDCRWEEVIASMRPKLVLQEDLHGCERQQLRGLGYIRSWLKVRRYDLQPFRPWSIFPGELNLILWRRRDFDDEEVQASRWKPLYRLGERFIG